MNPCTIIAKARYLNLLDNSEYNCNTFVAVIRFIYASDNSKYSNYQKSCLSFLRMIST